MVLSKWPRRTMTLTREGVMHRLESGRWLMVSTRPAGWFVGDARYEVQWSPLGGAWRPAAPEDIGKQANMRYRVRLKPEFLREPFATEMKGEGQ